MVDNDKDTWWPNLNGINKTQRSYKGISIKDFVPSHILLETGDHLLTENGEYLRID